MGWQNEVHTRMQNRRRNRLERMGEHLQSRFSTVYMDVRRQLAGQPAPIEIYSNISVHMTRRNIDNPDPQAVTHTPVIVSVQLAVPVDTDVRNGDVLTIKVANSEREITDAFRGVSSSPFTVHSRKRVLLAVQALGRDDIRDDVTPLPPEIVPPPESLSKITVRFLDENDADIREPIIYMAIIGQEMEIEALAIHGFSFNYLVFDGIAYGGDLVTFTPIEPEHNIKFIYDALLIPLYLRPFHVGRFRRSNGALVTTGNLAHWYRRINFRWLGQDDDIMKIAVGIPPLSSTATIRHTETAATLTFRQGTRVLIMPQDFVAQIMRIERTGNEFLMGMVEVAATDAERNAEITEFYDFE